MFFDDYKKYANAKLDPALLWEYDISAIDFHKMRELVVQRVIERGWKNDWYFILNYYSVEGVKEAIKKIPYLNDKDRNFARILFRIPTSEMKCYEQKQSRPQHWNS